MKQADIRLAVQDYLRLVHQGTGGEQDDLDFLEYTLDRLALAYRHAHYRFEDGHPDPPSIDYQTIREAAAARFPRLGLYNVPEFITSHHLTSPLVQGDAIDDIADIARDLADVEWCWLNTSANDALWHFRIGWETHWGGHLRALQWYLQAFRDEQ